MTPRVTRALQRRLETTFPVSKTTETGVQARSHQSITTGERGGCNHQGERNSGVEPEEFRPKAMVSRRGYSRQDRAAKKDQQSRDSDYDGRTTRETTEESTTTPVPGTALSIPVSRSCTGSLGPRATTHQSLPTQHSRAAATERRRWQKLTAGAPGLETTVPARR